ncbi:hypothetical protein [Streptomyces violaceusniger]|uniref:Tyr recombinase domain-containing protein n=1 Tax=Streptomyces violaceusniger (strain Tu 4113) TaxID=653045 RepID=G2PI14_STRV4|nr:hypothetical protein [Streptomyces violaceusniger]AEM88965.1 hypothetical protein Strvi_0192 [Streptomyces violaceusniger Tu 4113]
MNAALPDPWAIRNAWLSGTWTRPDGSLVTGRLWDADTIYRWERYTDHWISQRLDAGDLWQPTGETIREWVNRLIRWDTGQRLGPRSRARAVSIILSFYEHCEQAHGLGPFRLPKRWKIVGVVEEKHPTVYQPWVTDALRTAADQFQGLPSSPGRGPHMQHPSRHRLACYLLLCGLRPKQAILLALENLQPDPTAKILRAKIPLKHHADDQATHKGTLPWPLWRAIEDFLSIRQHQLPATGPHFGPVLTTRSGAPYKRENFRELIRPVVASHPDLADIQPPVRPAWISRSPSPWTHHRDDDQDDDTGPRTTDPGH